MITVQELRRAFWRNRFSPTPVLWATLSLNAAYHWTPAQAPELLLVALRERWPDLDIGDDAAALIAALAQQMQNSGDVTGSDHGVGARDEPARNATVYFSCRDHIFAEAALDAALRIVNRLTEGMPAERFAAMIDTTMTAARAIGFDQSTRAMIAEAQRRDVPWIRSMRVGHHVLIGQGAKQKMLRETLRSGESAIGRELARNKMLTLSVLAPMRVPTGQFATVSDIAGALKAAETIGYPLVLKPTVGQKGEGVFAGLRTAEELRHVFATLKGPQQLLVQSFFPGDDHRLLVVDGKLIAAAKRLPASVTGDGVHTVMELIAETNRDPRRGRGFSKLMNLIVADAETDRLLARRGLQQQSVPAAGDVIALKAVANIASGGTAQDVTAIVHADNMAAAIRAAKGLELVVAGVDFISPDITKSWRETGGGICEVNSIVGLRPHWLANPEHNVIAPIFDTMVQPGETLRIPTAMVTGTKGKTTTCWMLGAMLAHAGHTVGTVTTEGVSVGGEEIARGDYAGYTGAHIVLRDPMVTAAVLETARGGLNKSGTYLDWCDVGALLNVGREQIEMDEIDTVEQLAAIKRKVLESARKAVVLNADDEFCRSMVGEFRDTIRTILFSLDPGSQAVRKHCRRGGEALIVAEHEGKNTIVLKSGSSEQPLVPVAEITATMDGLITPNLANAMAATGLALGLGLPLAHIRGGLRDFHITPDVTRGRFNFVDDLTVRLVFDRATIAPGFVAVIPVFDAVPVAGRRFCVVNTPGNRPDWSFTECARLLAGHFDRFICFERDDRRRGRAIGEIAERLSAALVEAGVANDIITRVADVKEAARLVATEARSDDFVAVFAAPDSGIEDFRAAFEASR